MTNEILMTCSEKSTHGDYEMYLSSNELEEVSFRKNLNVIQKCPSERAYSSDNPQVPCLIRFKRLKPTVDKSTYSVSHSGRGDGLTQSQKNLREFGNSRDDYQVAFSKYKDSQEAFSKYEDNQEAFGKYDDNQEAFIRHEGNIIFPISEEKVQITDIKYSVKETAITNEQDPLAPKSIKLIENKRTPSLEDQRISFIQNLRECGQEWMLEEGLIETVLDSQSKERVQSVADTLSDREDSNRKSQKLDCSHWKKGIGKTCFCCCICILFCCPRVRPPPAFDMCKNADKYGFPPSRPWPMLPRIKCPSHFVDALYDDQTNIERDTDDDTLTK